MKTGRFYLAVIILVVAGTICVPAVSFGEAPLKKVILVLPTTNFVAGTAPYAAVPKYLGYWKEQGLDVEIQGAAGSRNAAQMVLSGKAQTALVVPIDIFLFGSEGAGLKAFYTVYRQNWFYPVVLTGSPVNGIEDFRGKTIGVQSMGAAMVPFTKALAAQAGLDPEKDMKFVSAGLGASAAALLAEKRIDILFLWSGQYALMENAGFKLKRLDIPQLTKLSFCLPFVAQDPYVKEHPDVIVALGRGIAMGTLFSTTNPEAAVRIHWKLYPQSKPAGESESDSMRKALHELKSATDFMRIDNVPVKKWGYSSGKEVEDYAEFLVTAGVLKMRLKNASSYYSGEFIDKMNQFNSQKVMDQAKRFKIE
jgi:NitT/TauT family transport system substrate-binding protein